MLATLDAVLAQDQRRAEEASDRVIRPAPRPEDDGKFVVVAFEADDCEIDADSRRVGSVSAASPASAENSGR